MFRFIIGIALALALIAPARGLADPTPAGADLWRRDESRITFTRARFSLPTRAGAVALEGAYEFGHPGEGLDSGLQYESADRQVFASIYVYAPSLAHTGVTAFATDNAIRVQSGTNLRMLSSRTVAAGGHDGVAIRSDYAGFRQARNASSAAFIRAGFWIIKLRVSGPEARRAEVEAAMSALLADLRFTGDVAPRAAEPLDVGACPSRSDSAARVLPHYGADTLEDAVFDVSNAVQDEPRREQAGHETTVAFGRSWCLSSSARIGNSNLPILRATSPPGSNALNAVLIASISDSGTLIEVVEYRERHLFIMYYHQIGSTLVLGRYATIPTDRQIADIVSGADRDGGRARATVTYPADGNSSITINEQLTTPPAPTT